MAKMGRPKVEKPKRNFLSIRLTDELHARLLEYTLHNNKTMTEVALEGLELVLSREVSEDPQK